MPAQEAEKFSEFGAGDAPLKLLEFIRLFNEEKYFESHEILEDLWRKTTGKKKRFYQGLIQAAVALHHAKTQNSRGALNEYLCSIEKLKEFPANFLGLRLKKFRKELVCFFRTNRHRKIFPRIDTNSKN